MAEQHQTTQVRTQAHERRGSFGFLRSRRGKRAARAMIEGALEYSPEIAKTRTKERIDRSLQLASGRSIQGPEADARVDLKTMSHQSRTHDHTIRTLTIPGDRVGLPEDERVGLFATTSAKSSSVDSGTFDLEDDQVYVAHYSPEHSVRLEQITPEYLEEIDDQALSQVRDIANGVFDRENEERGRVTTGAFFTGI